MRHVTYEPSEAAAWMIHARCRGMLPAEFFPPDGPGAEHARQLCSACAVRQECLDYALTYGIDHGIWGGVAERERQRIQQQRRRDALRRSG